MRFHAVKTVLIALMLSVFSVSANAYLIGLENGSASERAALVGTLQSMGHTVTATIDGSLDLIISAPGNGTNDFPGIPYLQISDHGADLLDNSWQSLPGPGTVVTITLTGNHPILQGLAPSWTSYGFWHYDGQSYLGWVNAVPGLADGDTPGFSHADVLAVSGSNIYIGWNVYGPDASANDLLLLENSIEYLVTGSPVVQDATPVPALSTFSLALMLLLFAVAAVAYHRRSGSV